MNYNFCTAVGVVESFDIEIQTDTKVPVAEVSIFSRETDSWALKVLVAIVEDVDQKKAQNLSKGDIVFFTGKPTVMDGYNIILSNSFVILKKNKLDLPIEMCKISSLEYANLENVAAVAGKVCALHDSTINLIVKRNNFHMRGELTDNDYVRVTPTNSLSVKEGDFIVCIGQINEVGIEGMVAIIESMEEDF